MRRITKAEQRALQHVLAAGERFGYGNLIAHLQTAWARKLVKEGLADEAAARQHAGGSGYPFLMQDDIVERGEWDETGKRYEPVVR